MLDRFQFYGSILFRWILLILIVVWSGLSNRDTVIGIVKAIAPEKLACWMQEHSVMKDWPWYVWALGSVMILAGYILESSYRRFRTERDKANALQESMHPKLEILWSPGEQTYVMSYPAGSQNPSVHYRICIVNTSIAHAVNDIVVTLDRLAPYALDCVPCRLRLMNNIYPGSAPLIERFNLNPGDRQFVDFMEQKSGSPAFNIWHTVVPQITVQVPAQDYQLTIRVTSSNAPPVSKDFELFNNGALWGMREVNA